MNNTGEIYIKTENSELHIPIYDKITVITGNSSTGKTKMVSFLKACKSSKRNGANIESSIPLDDIVLISDEYTLNLMMAGNEKNKIIFIDRFNILATNELMQFMHTSNNLFIILGHRNITELTSQDAVLSMQCTGNSYICKQMYKNGIMHPFITRSNLSL